MVLVARENLSSRYATRHDSIQNFQNSRTLEMQILKLTCAVDLNMLRTSNLNGQNVFAYLTLNRILNCNFPKFSVLRRTFHSMEVSLMTFHSMEVSLIILNSGILLKTFTHASMQLLSTGGAQHC